MQHILCDVTIARNLRLLLRFNQYPVQVHAPSNDPSP
jgi:hypothetical protein